MLIPILGKNLSDMEASKTIEKLIIFYTDWKNSLLTVPNWAKMHEITISECVILLNTGKRLSKLPIENIEI